MSVVSRVQPHKGKIKREKRKHSVQRYVGVADAFVGGNLFCFIYAIRFLQGFSPGMIIFLGEERLLDGGIYIKSDLPTQHPLC